jgi:HTH-type transcriptional regulator, sugar sensing transcriptional regulator
MFEKELEKIGLSEKEAKVYLSSLRLGKSPVQVIAKDAKINRGTTYNIISSLIKKGLMSTFQEGKKQFFFAESPDQLELIFKQQLEQIEHNRNKLKEILPELKQMDNKDSDKPVVRYFEGKNGIRAMVEDMFKVKKGTEIIMAYSYDDIENIFSKKDMEDWKNYRIKKDINILAMYNKIEGKYPGESVKSQSIKIPKDKFSFRSDVAIYEDRIRIASFGEKVMGVIIEDKNAAETLRSVFKLAWEASKKYSD